MAANPSGEDASSAQGRGVTPARVAVIAVLAIAVIALGYVIFSGGSEHKYNLLFQNASQLVPDNQVLIGGQPVGSVESIELTDDNLAKVVVSVEQELHEGTTATIRATSLSGVANHYVSISPGPEQQPAAGRRRDARPRLDHDADRHRPALQHLPGAGPPRPRPVHPGQRRSLCRPRQGRPTTPSNTSASASTAPAPSPTSSTPTKSSSPASSSARAGSAPRSPNAATELSSAISNANAAFGAIAKPERRPRHQPAAAAADLPPGQHDLRQPARRPRRRRTADRHLEAGDQEPGAVPRRTAAGALQGGAGLQEPAPDRAPQRLRQRLGRTARLPARRAAARLAGVPALRRRDHRLPAQPQLHPRLHAGPLQRLRPPRPGQPAPTTATATTCAAASATSTSSTTTAAAANWNRSRPSEQYDVFGSSAGVKKRCPGGASQPAADGSSPFVEPPHSGSGVTTSDCNPADAPPGP